jgi:hypothetical protein
VGIFGRQDIYFQWIAGYFFAKSQNIDKEWVIYKLLAISWLDALMLSGFWPFFYLIIIAIGVELIRHMDVSDWTGVRLYRER